MNMAVTGILSLLCLCEFDASLFSQPMARSSAIIFSSGFEEGNKSIWNDYDSNPDSTNLLLLHPGPFNRTNNHVMRFHVPPGRGGADLVKVLPQSYDKVYCRWYQQWERGYDFSARNHGSALHGGNRVLLGRSNYRPTGEDMFSCGFEPADGRMNLYVYYRGMYMDCVNPNGQCWGDHFPCWFDEGEHICTKAEHRERLLPPHMESGRWYCFEMMLDAGAPVPADSLANGHANFWIDGIEYGPWEHLWFRTTPDLKITVLWLSLFHHAEHSTEGILLDDVVVATERIGCDPLPTQVGESNQLRSRIELYPNPTRGAFTLSVAYLSAGIASIRISNLFGQTVATDAVEFQGQMFTREYRFDRFPLGIYYLQCSFDDGHTVTKLIHHRGNQ